MNLTVSPDSANERVDRFVAAECPDLSRSAVQRLIEDGRILVEGAAVRTSYRVVPGESISVDVPAPEPVDIVPEDTPLDVRYEDEDLLVVNKPPGMSVHPSGRVRRGTLVNALMAHCENLSGINGELRPGIVHRLDKDTSGLLMVAKTDRAHRGLAEQLEARTVFRRYLGLCWGHPKEDAGRVEAPVGRSRSDRKKMAVQQEGEGRFAVTRFEVVGRYDFASRLTLRLETGRTHQIRVHLAHIGHPIFGDGTYGGRRNRLKGISPLYRQEATRVLAMTDRQMLHAEALGFRHPVTGEEVSYEANPPADMQAVLDAVAAGATT